MMNPFPEYPKKRKPLPEAYQAIYLNHYLNSREGRTTTTSLISRLEGWMHHKVAADRISVPPMGTSLEIGAGTLNHLAFEPTSTPYDIVEPFRELFLKSPHTQRIRNIFTDIADIPKGEKYSRIISIATFEHILNLPEVAARSALLLEPQGHLRIAIPNEGRWMWTIGWKLSSAIEFRLRYGLDYSVLMAYEHINSAKEIESVLHFFFQHVSIKCFGLGKWASFYLFFDCSQPNLNHSNHYLSHISAFPKEC